MPNPFSTRPRWGWALVSALIVAPVVAAGQRPPGDVAPAQRPPGEMPPPARPPDPFERFDLPDDWEARYWADPQVQDLLKKGPKAVADLVPAQAGLRHCRCPACDSDEAADTLAWSPAKPEVVTCRRCGEAVPSDKFPAKVPPALGQPPVVPEELVEVLPRVVHHYPYHIVDPLKARYPEERLYLAAKRDYEAREFLSRLALYAAVRHREQPAAAGEGPDLAGIAAALVLRFALVYPSYATHFDQPVQPKFLQQADLKPPYRRGYRTAKWDWSGCLDVPMNLVIAYALIRDDPALAEAGRLLGDEHPARTIENGLFRASAEFVRQQPEEYSEASIYAYRGMLAVGRLLDDANLMHEALLRLEGFTERGFYHDGLWRQGDASAHRRVMGLIDGWIDRFLVGYRDARSPSALPGARALPMVGLAREAGGVALADSPPDEVRRVAWPAPAPSIGPRQARLLGGAGVARLAVGAGADALDVEIQGQGANGGELAHRLTLRVAVAGRPVLGDADGPPPSPRGFERSTASRNAVLVDGLNQRESFEQAHAHAPGSDILYFAADPDFQVAALDDRYAYPTSTTRYRHMVAACAGARSRYALSVFEIRGGLQHDQIYHAPAGSPARWRLSLRMAKGPESLLPPMIPFVPKATADDGRWFVQSYGEFSGLASGQVDRPSQAILSDGQSPGVRLHLLGETPAWAVTGTTPDPSVPTPELPSDPAGRAALVLRRRSEDGTTLKTTFVTLFEPVGAVAPLKRVGRLASPEGSVAVAVETEEGLEHLVINQAPGTAIEVSLADGRTLRTDGLAVRVAGQALRLAGGTFAELDGTRLEQARVAGTIRATGRSGLTRPESRGWFDAAEPLPDPERLVGRTLIVRHGDARSRGWTILHAENRPTGGARIEVREVPGFQVDPTSGEALYYQYPRDRIPGPHRFTVSQMSR